MYIVPLHDLAEEDSSDNVAGKIERTDNRRKVVAQNVGSENRRDVQNRAALGLRQLFVAHRSVRRTEVHRSLGKLADAAAGTDRLIVDFDSGTLGVIGEPLRVDGIWKGCTGSSEIHRLS